MCARPAHLASLLRTQAGHPNRIPVDLDNILSYCPVEVAECPLDGCLGLYIPPPIGPGILIRAGQTPEQRRFTIAHEIGHFALPTHNRAVELVCASKDIYEAAIRSTVEREANQFAAELLMPRSHFALAVSGREPSMALVNELADRSRFFVSRTAAAIRLVELSDEPCALVCSQGGRVKWWLKSGNCSGFLNVSSGAPVSPDSVAAAIWRGEAANSEPEAVPPNAWFSSPHHYVEVFESTLAIPSLGEVISLLWLIEEW